MSREIDALVAEHVMGWRDSGIKPHYGATVWATGNDASPTYTGFYPSAKIEPAWLVVEKMRERFPHFDFWTVKDDEDGEFVARFADWPNTTPTFDAYAHTAPMAICLAALKACGVNAEEAMATATAERESTQDTNAPTPDSAVGYQEEIG